MIIVAGHLSVDPSERDSYLAGCVEVIEQARRAPGCLDYALNADLIEPDRINIFERWNHSRRLKTSAVTAPPMNRVQPYAAQQSPNMRWQTPGT